MKFQTVEQACSAGVDAVTYLQSRADLARDLLLDVLAECDQRPEEMKRDGTGYMAAAPSRELVTRLRAFVGPDGAA